MRLAVLHTNDLHGKLDTARALAISELRSRCDLYFDSGDCVKSGNLGVPLGEEPVWRLLAQCRCDASVIGNRETHLLASAFRAKLAGAAHPVLCANLRAKDGRPPLPGTASIESNGVRIGVLGVSVAMVTERMASAVASAFLWDDPVSTAIQTARELRAGSDLVIALTHIGHRADRDLAETTSDIDIILGGHSHTVLQEPLRVGATWVCQGGSHARFVGRYEWDTQARSLTGGLVPLPA